MEVHLDHGVLMKAETVPKENVFLFQPARSLNFHLVLPLPPLHFSHLNVKMSTESNGNPTRICAYFLHMHV
jgi:hypothetical protein